MPSPCKLRKSVPIVGVATLPLYSFIVTSFQVQESKITETKINEAREHYRPAAARASLLYFIMNDLNTINPMYQFSLKVQSFHLQ